ncbi:hypothetical protein MASR2M79_08720 [Aminivibrio sp.]
MVQTLKDNDVFMVAPKGPGHLVRRMYTEGRGVPCLLAVQQDASGQARELGLAYACAIGGGRAGVLSTTFKEETETDLFGEQAVLCGGITELVEGGIRHPRRGRISAGDRLLRVPQRDEADRRPDVRRGHGVDALLRQRHGEIRRPHRRKKVIDGHVRQRMKELLDDVQDGSFAKDWILENQCGRPRMKKWLDRENEHPIEAVGRELRGMMPWMDAKSAPGK